VHVNVIIVHVNDALTLDILSSVFSLSFSLSVGREVEVGLRMSADSIEPRSLIDSAIGELSH
jgi:hypothetical protein